MIYKTVQNRYKCADERLGIDTSTAVRMFLKRAVMENGIPFRMTLPKEPYSADRGYRAMVEIGDAAEKNGVSDMSLDEINAEIEASRKERQAVGRWGYGRAFCETGYELDVNGC